MGRNYSAPRPDGVLIPRTPLLSPPGEGLFDPQAILVFDVNDVDLKEIECDESEEGEQC